jgi:GNAT superfamily N-acetyltransferase
MGYDSLERVKVILTLIWYCLITAPPGPKIRGMAQLGVERDERMHIRTFKPADLLFVVQSHMDYYGKAYGFDETFRHYVGDAVDRFLETFDPELENIWIVEENGKPAGSIAIVKVDAENAQLRWFLLEEPLRGKGIGNQLMTTTIQFCRKKGYRTIYLWTVAQLDTARYLYRKYGFAITDTAAHDIWGQSLVEERWDLTLD